MASVFLLPSCCSFWFPVRETGGFFKGWPRFIAVRHSFCVPAGGTVDAQTVMLTASPVLCCAAWETALEYQWIFFLYQLSLSFYLPFSLSLPPSSPKFFVPPSLSGIFSSTSTCSCPSPFLFSLGLSHFVAVSLPRSLCCCLSWGLSAAAGLSCAVICHTTEGKKHLLLMLPPSLSFCASLSQAIWFLPSSQLLSLLFLTSPLLFFLKSPFGCFFPKCQAVSLHRVASFQQAQLLLERL